MADPTISSGYPRAISNPYATGTPRAATSGPALDPYGQQRFAEGMQAATSYASVPATPSYMGAMTPEAQYAYGMDPEDPRLQQAELLALRQQQDAMTQQGASMTPENALAMQKLASLGLNQAAAAQFIAENQDPQVSQAMAQAGQEVAQVTDKAAEEAKPKGTNWAWTAFSVGVPTVLSFIPGFGTAAAATVGGAMSLAEQTLIQGKSFDKVNWLEVGATAAVSALPGGAGAKLGAKAATAAFGKSAAQVVGKSAAAKFSVNLVEKGVAGAVTGGIGGSTVEAARQIGSGQSLDLGQVAQAGTVGAVTGGVLSGGIGGTLAARGKRVETWGTPQHIEAQAGGKFLSLPAKGVDAAGTKIARAGEAIGTKANQAKQAVSNGVDNFVNRVGKPVEAAPSALVKPNLPEKSLSDIMKNGGRVVDPNAPVGLSPTQIAERLRAKQLAQPQAQPQAANTQYYRQYNADGSIVTPPPTPSGSNQYSKPIGPKPAIGHVPNPGQKVLPSAEMRSGPVDPSTGLPKPNLDAEGNILDPWAQPQPQPQPQTQAKAKTQSGQPEVQAETKAQSTQPEVQAETKAQSTQPEVQAETKAQSTQPEVQAETKAQSAQPQPEVGTSKKLESGSKASAAPANPLASKTDDEVGQLVFGSKGLFKKGKYGHSNVGGPIQTNSLRFKGAEFDAHDYQSGVIQHLKLHPDAPTANTSLPQPNKLINFSNDFKGAEQALKTIQDFNSNHLNGALPNLSPDNPVTFVQFKDAFLGNRFSTFPGQTLGKHEKILHHAFETLQRQSPENLAKLGITIQ